MISNDYLFNLFLTGSNYTETLSKHLSSAAVSNVISWLNSTNPVYSLKDENFTAELLPGEHVQVPISVSLDETQCIAWNFIVEDGGLVDFHIDIVLPAPGSRENASSSKSTNNGTNGSTSSSFSSSATNNGTNGSTSSSFSSSAVPIIVSSSSLSFNECASPSLPRDASIARKPVDPSDRFSCENDVYKSQCSHKYEVHTRKQVSCGNSYLNWPFDIGGLLVISFKRSSQSWLSRLTRGIPGMDNYFDERKPIKFKYKISSFDHKI
jgi:hypothetical protein